MILSSVLPTLASLSPAGLLPLASSSDFHLPASFAEFSPLLIPILVPAVFFLFITCMVALGVVKKIEQEKARQATIRMAIEKGQPIPPEMLAEKQFQIPPELLKAKAPDDRKTGLILVAGGIGSFVALRAVDLFQIHGIEWFAAIPFLIGVALLLNYALQQKKP